MDDESRLEHLRSQRLLARQALERAGKLAFKPVTSAKWTRVTTKPRGSIHAQIEHDNVKGVTPEMVKWWFENLSGTTTWNGDDFTGPEILNYHLWHHRDHISVTPLTNAAGSGANKGFQAGALSRIDEQFNDYRERIHGKVRTTRLDTSEFNIDMLLGPLVIGKLNHRYAPVPGGVSFYAEMVVDVRIPLIGPLLNWIIRPRLFSRAAADHWIRHNIEETGRTEDIVPALYQAAHPEAAG